VRTGGLRVGWGSTGLREVRSVEAPEASSPDFTGVILKFPHLMSKVRVQNWVLVAGVDKAAHRVVAFPSAPWPVQAPLISPYTWKLWPL
jgi:hypothetical protein